MSCCGNVLFNDFACCMTCIIDMGVFLVHCSARLFSFVSVLFSLWLCLPEKEGCIRCDVVLASEACDLWLRNVKGEAERVTQTLRTT